MREWPAGWLITKLFDEDGAFVSSSADLAKVCNSFYSKLYACPKSNEQRREFEEEILSSVSSKFLQTTQRILEAPFTIVV